jgi:hypothetical protein
LVRRERRPDERYPIVNVAPADKVLDSSDVASPGAINFERPHTHLILAPASSWPARAS